MSAQITISKGLHRGKVVSGTFPLIKGYVEGARGGFVTVKVPVGTSWAMNVRPRITVDIGDFTVFDADGTECDATVSQSSVSSVGFVNDSVVDYERKFIESETEEEAMERMHNTFAMLDKITDSIANGDVRGLVVSGPPGIGKSFGVEKQLQAANIFRKMKGQEPMFEIISGGVSAIKLYQKLYDNRNKEQVVVFDDDGGTLFDEECLSLLKNALNSGDKRTICWNKESRILKSGDIPDKFEFEGGIIFLSNIDFDKTIARKSRISSHLEAILSRCHYLDLEIVSLRDKMMRIKQVVKDGMLSHYNFSDEHEASIIEFVTDNAEYLREVSLRMVKKIADFVKTDPDNWEEFAEATCLTKESKYKRLLEKKQRIAISNAVCDNINAEVIA